MKGDYKMKACTFFGHRDCPDSIRPMLMKVIIQLIYMEDVEMFYVGNQGRFDQVVLSVLREIHEDCDDFNYAVVLAYHPESRPAVNVDANETMFPEEMEGVYPKFAISRRNDWMLKHSNYVVAFMQHSWGGAAKYVNKARKMNKNIFSIYKNETH